jgi:hypothetical protein
MSEKSMITESEGDSDEPRAESEAMQAQAEALRTQLDALRAQLAEERESVRRDRRDAAIRAEAEALRAVNAEDVIAWAAAQSPDMLAAALDDAGKARQIVMACKAARPHFFASSAPGSPSNFGAIAQMGDRDQIARALKGRKLFRL